ncbi:hypothetical protein SASPL_144929 [Salvia splendens]|uniref:Protein-lysine N-methyltransferase SASPL_144929 n=1 Tax=Salvia splendens TaxID=180675 RepID=A0A8X8WGM5_SALSN|nr:hypothetical protein SASPL_144929 [Salvia splendens]
MAGIRLPPEDSDVSQAARQVAAIDLISDDDRSIAADSWSIKSDYGSTLDDEQRQADAAEALSSAAYRAASDYSSDKEEPDAEAVSSMLGFQSYWDAAYADELANFREHGHAGEVWFGPDVMENMATWTKNVCLEISQRNLPNHVDNTNCLPAGKPEKDLSGWSILDVGTGNGLLLQELSKLGHRMGYKKSPASNNASFVLRKTDRNREIENVLLVFCDGLEILMHCVEFLQESAKCVLSIASLESKFEIKCACKLQLRMPCGLMLSLMHKWSLRFSDLTGTDYSEAAVDLARNLAQRDGFHNIKFLVDDILDTKLDRKFQLVTDKGTLDAIGLHPDGPIKRIMYWDSVSGLVASGGLVVITSCNNTKDELIQEVEVYNQRRNGGSREADGNQDAAGRDAIFEYVDHIRTYPTFMFGGSVGSRVATVAFLRK